MKKSAKASGLEQKYQTPMAPDTDKKNEEDNNQVVNYEPLSYEASK